MSDDPNSLEPPPRRFARLRRWLLRGALALTLAFVGLYLSRRLWLPGFVRAVAPVVCERLVGFELEIDEVLSADFDRLELRGVRLRGVDPAFPVRTASARELSAEFSIPGLIRDWTTGLHGVRGRELELALDVTAPSEDDSEESAPLELPPYLPRVDLEGVAFSLELPDARLTLDVRQLACADGATLELATGAARWAEGEGGFAFRELALRARYEAARIESLALVTDGEPRLADVAVDMTRLVERGELDLDGRVLTPGGGAVLELELRPDTLALRAHAEGLLLDRFRRFLSAPLDDLAGAVDLVLDARLPLESVADSEAHVQLVARDLALAGQRAAHVELGASLTERTLRVDSLEALDGPNELRARDLALSIDELELDEWLRRLHGEVELELVEPARLRLELPPELARAAREAHLVLAASIAEGVATFQQLDLVAPGLDVQLARGQVRLEPLDAPELDIELDVVVDALDTALQAFGLEGYAGRLDGYLSASGRPDELVARAVVEGEELVLAGVAVGSLALDAELDRDTARVLRLVASSPGGELDAEGEYSFATGELIDCRLRARLLELQKLLPDHAHGGALYVDLRAQGALESPSVELSATGVGLELEDLPPLDAGVVGRLVQGEVTIDALRVSSGEDALFASGGAWLGDDFLPTHIDLLALEHRQQGRVSFALVEPAHVELADGGVRVGKLTLAGEQGQVVLDLEHTPDGTHAALSTEGYRPGPLLTRLLPAGFGFDSLDLDVALDVLEDRLALAARVHGAGVRVAGIERPFTLDLAVGEGRTRGELVADARADFGPAGRVDLFARAAIDPTRPGWLVDDEVALELGVELEDLEDLIDWEGQDLRGRGSLFAFLELSGAPERLEGSLWFAAEGLGATAVADGASFGPARAEARVGFTDVIALETFTFEAGQGEASVGLALEGAVTTPLDARAMLADLDAWRCAADIDLHAWSSTADLTRAAEILDALDPRDLPVRAGALVLDLQLEGTLAEPLPRGRLELRDGVLRLGADMPSADRVGMELRLLPHEVRLVRLSGELGGSEFRGEGRVDLSGPEPVLDLEFYGTELLLARSRDLRLRANADVIVIGPASEPTIAGLVTLVDARYTKNLELDVTRRSGPSSGARGMQLFRFRDPPLSRARFDIDVRATEAVSVENTTLRSTLWPDLVLKGTGELPVLLGSVFLEPSYVRLPGGTLTIDSGTIRFTQANPFVPTLALNGSARMRGYDIQVVIAGTADAPEITLSSNPPLSNDALLVLLTTGQLPDSSAGSTAGQTATALATYLAEDIFAREFGGGPSEGDSLISRFEILTGQDISYTGAETIWVSFRMSGNDPRARRHWHLVGERDIWDYYNYGLRITFKFR